MARRFAEEGGRLLVVGGSVRDDRLAALFPGSSAERQIGDLDLAAFGLEFSKILSLASEFGPASPVGHRLRTDRVSKTPALIQTRSPLACSISPSRRLVRGEMEPDPAASVAEDALARDFTCDALYWDPLTDEFEDPLGGLNDLKARRLELCSPEGLSIDPVRSLRAMRFISRLDLVPGPGLLKAAENAWPSLELVPPSRLWPEWRGWACASRPRSGLDFLKASSALRFWPELAALVGSPQFRKYHPEGDAWNHTVLTVEAIGRLRSFFNRDDAVFLTLAALLHDVGKPSVTVMTPEGRPITKGHAAAGPPPALRFLSSISAPQAVKRSVVRIIERHMDLSFTTPDRPKLRVLARRLAPHCDLGHFWALASADWNGRKPWLEPYPWTLEDFLEPVDGRRGPAEAPVDAGRLMSEFGLAGGPIVGKLVRLVNEAFDRGDVSTAAEAIELAAAALAGGELEAG
jgi:tRNA nucleotidyltransferase/poly(A) polymerase